MIEPLSSVCSSAETLATFCHLSVRSSSKYSMRVAEFRTTISMFSFAIDADGERRNAIASPSMVSSSSRMADSAVTPLIATSNSGSIAHSPVSCAELELERIATATEPMIAAQRETSPLKKYLWYIVLSNQHPCLMPSCFLRIHAEGAKRFKTNDHLSPSFQHVQFYAVNRDTAIPVDPCCPSRFQRPPPTHFRRFSPLRQRPKSGHALASIVRMQQSARPAGMSHTAVHLAHSGTFLNCLPNPSRRRSPGHRDVNGMKEINQSTLHRKGRSRFSRQRKQRLYATVPIASDRHSSQPLIGPSAEWIRFEQERCANGGMPQSQIRCRESARFRAGPPSSRECAEPPSDMEDATP